ncbi:MAG: bluetail domain-containing putative surface protein [Silvanigrellaceae bacterium]
MKIFSLIVNIFSLLALTSCSFESALNKNIVQLEKNGQQGIEQNQGLAGQGRASSVASRLESASKRKETPESYQRAIDRAVAHIKAKPDAMLTNSDYSFSVRTVIIDEASEESIRLESRYKGRRVIGGDVVVQSKSDGSLKKIEKSLQKEIKLSASGLISSELASDIAQSVFDGEIHDSSEPEMIVYAVGGEPKEAFEVVLKGSHGSSYHPSELHVFVDALSGAVITKWDAICEGIERESAAAAEQMLTASGTDPLLTADNSVVIGASLLPLDQTFKLHSKPDASKVIYLDFDGHTTSGTDWNSWNNGVMGTSFYSPPYNIDANSAVLSDNEKVMIQIIWQRVAADFAAFDIDVTTQEPPQDWLMKSDSTDVNYGIRVVITRYGPASGSAGGIAYIDSFNWGSDTPCFVYNTSVLGVSEAISHEAGHTLGLSHDGTFDGTTAVGYYAGNSTELDQYGWAPIMGLGYYRNMTTWDNGVYYQSNNTGSTANYGKGADDLGIVTGYNGFSYAQDTESDLRLDAAPLNPRNGMVGQFGTIQTASDVDWFRIDLPETSDLDLRFFPSIYRASVDSDGVWGGSYDVNIANVWDTNTTNGFNDHATNLNLTVTLYTGSGGIWGSFLNGMRIGSLPAGTYYLKLEGIGYGDPTTATGVGFTDYASIGHYLISGTIAPLSSPVSLPVITLALPVSSVTEDGTENLMFNFTRSVVTADPLTVYFQVRGSAGIGVDYTGLLPVVTQSVTFAANAATAVVLVDPVVDGLLEGDESVRLQLTFGSGYTIGTTTEVIGTILNDDLASSAPAISLALSPISVSEDGSGNLVFTFTRSVVTADPLTVSFTASGSATSGIDFNGLVVGSSSQTATFAANAATATVVIDPIADSGLESDETVNLTLLAGTGYTLGTSTTATGVILNDDVASQVLTFTVGTDALSGTGSTNTFRLVSLSDALWSSTPDRITNLNTVSDMIDIPAARTRALKPQILGAVQSLDTASIAALLTSRSFVKGGAATFTFNSSTGVRTFLAINDAVSGFNAATDAVIEITGYTGSLSMLAVY